MNEKQIAKHLKIAFTEFCASIPDLGAGANLYDFGYIAGGTY